MQGCYGPRATFKATVSPEQVEEEEMPLSQATFSSTFFTPQVQGQILQKSPQFQRVCLKPHLPAHPSLQPSLIQA